MNSQADAAEKSLLLYLEKCAVDYGGNVNVAYMSSKDIDTAHQWASNGYIEFDISNFDSTCWVRLSEQAWKDAHAERRARAKQVRKGSMK